MKNYPAFKELIHVRCQEPATTPAQNTTEEVELEPLPNKFTDYDVNEDGFLQYEEFTHAIMSVHPISDPSELRGMFELWDTNGKWYLKSACVDPAQRPRFNSYHFFFLRKLVEGDY